jgi:hypothetical protein
VSPKLKAFLIIALKQAVNAILTNGGLMAMMGNHFNFHSWAGFRHVLYATASVIGGREAMVWLPRLLTWSQATDERASAQAAGKP